MTGNDEEMWRREPDLGRLREAHARRVTSPAWALAELEKLSAEGSVASCLYLGQMFRDGLGVDANRAEAEKFYRKAYDAGSLNGLLSLGSLYFDRHSYDVAEAIFREGANRQYAPAMDKLAMIYLKRGQFYNPRKARLLLEKASVVGNVFAKRHLAGVLIREGPGLRARIRGVGLFYRALVEGIQVFRKEPSDERVI